MPRTGRRLTVPVIALCLALAGCSSSGASGASGAATPSENSPVGDIPDDQVWCVTAKGSVGRQAYGPATACESEAF